MKKMILPLLILSCFYIAGCCSIPRRASYSQLYSFAKEEKKAKGMFGSKGRVLVKDFRGDEIKEQDTIAIKEKIEKYILGHNELSDSGKNNLRELKVTAGATKEEVELLLGKADKVIKTDAASETWIYRTSKATAFTIVFLPVFFTHEAYYLRFKDNALTAIERRYLEQTFESSDMGIGALKH